MATITIPDVTYQRLKDLAAARKISLSELLNEVAAANGVTRSDAVRQLAALESFAAGMTQWTSKHLPPGHVVDDSREAIYEGRGG